MVEQSTLNRLVGGSNPLELNLTLVIGHLLEDIELEEVLMAMRINNHSTILRHLYFVLQWLQDDLTVQIKLSERSDLDIFL